MIKQTEKAEYNRFTDCLKKQIEQFNIKEQFSEIIFLCIGTNKMIGDMIGPMVGEMLEKEIRQMKKYLQKEIVIYGNMQHTVNLKNAKQVLSFLPYRYENPFLITVDTALGKQEQIEKIFISSGEIEIGKALKQGIKYDSHLNIKGVVGKYDYQVEENINTLKNVEMKLIERMSKMISKGIKETVKKIA